VIGSYIVNYGYFHAMKVPLLAGRAFDERDHLQSQRVVIISQRLAERFWPAQDPLGRRIRRISHFSVVKAVSTHPSGTSAEVAIAAIHKKTVASIPLINRMKAAKFHIRRHQQ
jgi:hypothetical protein